MKQAVDRNRLAMFGGFVRPRQSLAHGTHQAAYLTCAALAEVGGYAAIDVFHENPGGARRDGELKLPARPATQLLDRLALPASGGRYQAIYVANGDQIGSVPHLLRPRDDWAPVICSVGTTHSAMQWQSLLVALASGALRPTDGWIFKSQAAQTLFRRVWDHWHDRLRLTPAFPQHTVVIPNGVDVQANALSAELRDQTRRTLRIGADDVVFLAFSRLSPGTKGDQLALIVRWKEVLERVPQALLVLAGAQVDRAFTAEMRHLARAAGVNDRLLILENPFELMTDARASLMSAADVFLHLTTGVEEASPLVVQEAMAHSLPVIATDWAGLPEVITHGQDGFLVRTRVAPAPTAVNEAAFAISDVTFGQAGARAVSCAFEDLVAAAVALADPSRRRQMGDAARRRTEGHTLRMMALAYAAYFRDRARAAEAGPVPPVVPLLTLDQVVGAQSRGRLKAEAVVRLAQPSNAELAVSSHLNESRETRLATIAAFALSYLESRGSTTIKDLVAAVQATPGLRSLAAGDALAEMGSVMTRLLDYGVIALDPE